MKTEFHNPVVVLDKTEYDALVSDGTRNLELLGIYLNALRYMIGLYHVADEAWDKDREMEVLKQLGVEGAKQGGVVRG